VNLKAICPEEVKQINVEGLKPTNLIEVSKIYSHNSTTENAYSCREKFSTKTCPCKKENINCFTKC